MPSKQLGFQNFFRSLKGLSDVLEWSWDHVPFGDDIFFKK
jgi:hypothetical protein